MSAARLTALITMMFGLLPLLVIFGWQGIPIGLGVALIAAAADMLVMERFGVGPDNG